jgi:hypothetical protein
VVWLNLSSIGGPWAEDELPMSKKDLRSLQQSNDKLLRNLEYVLDLWLRAFYGCDIADSGTELDALKAHSPTRSRYFIYSIQQCFAFQ